MDPRITHHRWMDGPHHTPIQVVGVDRTRGTRIARVEARKDVHRSSRERKLDRLPDGRERTGMPERKRKEREEERKGWNERLKHASVYGATRTVVSTTRVAEYFEERNEEATQEGSSILVTRNVVVRNEAKAGALSGMKTGSQERLCKSKQGL